MKEKHLHLLTSFLCGLCVMGVEMSATRLLSPYFGSTNLIWTVIICLIMVGLGGGNYFGGRLADRCQRPGVMYGGIAVGSIFIALIPLMSWLVFPYALLIVGTMNPQDGFLLAAIVSCVILFVPPIILLGMVSPYLAKLCVSDLNRTGVTLGRLQAFSTVGCIVGSVLPAFVLIPLIGTKLSFAVFAALLFAPCLLYWLSAKERNNAAKCTFFLLLAVAGALASGRAIAPDASEYETESTYQYLRVQRFEDFRVLSTGLYTYTQSTRRDDPSLLTHSYLDAFAALPELTGKETPVDMLVIGYGGGVLATLLDAQYGDVSSTFVEIDPEMVNVARKHFEANPNDHVIIDDGRRFLQVADKNYDVIAVDAYQDTSIPVNLVTREFFALCAQKLRPGGMCAINIAMAGNGENAFCRALGETMKQVFPHVAFIPRSGATNAIFVGSTAPLPFERALARRDKSWPLWTVISRMQQYALATPAGGAVMTDDRNNAEILQLEAYSLTRYQGQTIIRKKI